MGVARPTHAVRISLALKFQSIIHDVISKARTHVDKLRSRIGVDLVQILMHSGAVAHLRILQQQLQLLRRRKL